ETNDRCSPDADTTTGRPATTGLGDRHAESLHAGGKDEDIGLGETNDRCSPDADTTTGRPATTGLGDRHAESLHAG
ncbi:hypothetical protein CTI14_70020, partial [Methylobacterium radiotolerans]